MLTSPFVLRHVLVLAAAALVAGTAGADVYKYTDEKGNVLYTDKPATLPAERMHVQSQKTDTVSVQARQQADMARMQQSDQARQASANKQSNDQQAAELNAKDKADRCVKARERYDKYMNSQKLYEQQEGGERRYLTSEELDAARASAKASMEVLCK